jgi:hypothetical protein
MCVADGVSNENMEWLSGGKCVHVKEQGRSRTACAKEVSEFQAGVTAITIAFVFNSPEKGKLCRF